MVIGNKQQSVSVRHEALGGNSVSAGLVLPGSVGLTAEISQLPAASLCPSQHCCPVGRTVFKLSRL